MNHRFLLRRTVLLLLHMGGRGERNKGHRHERSKKRDVGALLALLHSSKGRYWKKIGLQLCGAVTPVSREMIATKDAERIEPSI